MSSIAPRRSAAFRLGAIAALAFIGGCTGSVGWIVPADDLLPVRQVRPGDRSVVQALPADARTARSAPPPPGSPDDPARAAEPGSSRAASPHFVGPQTTNARRPSARFAGSVSLYGEIGNRATGGQVDDLENLRRVSFTSEGADFDVDVAPGGKWFVFASTQHRPTSDLYMKMVDGTTVTQLTSDPAEDAMPAVSPDGQRVCFASNRSGNWDLYIKPIDGGQPVQLTDAPAQELHPSWSPDGKQIVFCSLGERSGQWEMVVVDVENPARRRFIGYGLFPEFSPDGKKIAFQRARNRGTRWFSVWTVDYIDGQGARPTQIAASPNAALITPSWSSDGKRLAFAAVVDPTSVRDGRRPDAADLWIVNLDGTGRVKLTGDRFVNLQPTWGDDGAVYFVSSRAGADNVWAVAPSDRSIAVQDADDGPDGEAQASAPVEAEQ